jgi:cation diffusion facilitator CzcD-associated flavoprotein CzcO
VDANFETNVPGLYIVGELGGRGLIKNAINEGKIAVEHVAKMVASPLAAPTGVVDVVVVGSGPAGLSAGLEALRRGLTYRVLEQGSLSDTVRKYPRRKILLAEPVRVPLYGDLWVADASKETYSRSGRPSSRIPGSTCAPGARGTWCARRWVHSADCRRRIRAARRAGHGATRHARRLGVPGEDLDKVFYDIVEMEAFANRRVLVVGGGDSAIDRPSASRTRTGRP